MAITFPSPKDPNEILDYTIDWSARVQANDSIVSFTVTGSGINVDSSVLSNNIITVWLSGGNVGSETSVLTRVVTTEGRTMDQTVKLKIVDK
jgi:hypothetical protein